MRGNSLWRNRQVGPDPSAASAQQFAGLAATPWLRTGCGAETRCAVGPPQRRLDWRFSRTAVL